MKWQGLDERIDVHAAAAVRAGGLTHFGTLHWIDGDRVMVEVDAELPQGTGVEIRTELSPLPGTGLLHGQVHRQLVSGADEMARFVFRVVSVEAEDAERVRQWVEQARVGGTARDLSAFSSSRPSRAGPHSSWSEAQVALRRIDERSGVVNTSGTRPADQAERERIRATLRSALARRQAVPPPLPLPDSAVVEIKLSPGD